MEITRKWIYNAVIICGRAGDSIDYEMRLALYDRAIAGLRHIMPRQLLSVFPPTKRYDGARFECKDYFSTMDAVYEHGIDTPLGERIIEFLFDYMNPRVMPRIAHSMFIRFISVSIIC